MPNKRGDRFTDKRGKNYVLGNDPEGGHLRPYADGKQPGSAGCASAILLFLGVIIMVAFATAWAVAAT